MSGSSAVGEGKEAKFRWGWGTLCFAAVLIVGLCYVIFTVGIPTNRSGEGDEWWIGVRHSLEAID